MSRNENKEEGLKRQLKHLQEEINNLKQDASRKNQSTKQQKQQLKNFQMVFIIDGGQQQNIQIISVICFIEQNFYRTNCTKIETLWETRHQFDQ